MNFRLCFFAAVLFFSSQQQVLAEDKIPFKPVNSATELPSTALLETSKGPIEIAFYRNKAQLTVQNFKYLAQKKFYNDTMFHRFVPDYVIQGGDPEGTGKGGPGYTLPPEISEVKFERGTLAMARRPNEVNTERRSHSSQFYICLSRAKHLDGHYTAFAQVINGMDVLSKLKKGDKIIQVKFPKKN